jgi:hypothetical protein
MKIAIRGACLGLFIQPSLLVKGLEELYVGGRGAFSRERELVAGL